MKDSMQRALFWMPRVLSILFALFVSIFALDVLEEGYGFWDTVLALFMHLIPVYVLVIALAIGWHCEWVGALLFTGFSVWYLVMVWEPAPLVDNLSRAWPIAGPPLLIGLLFLLDWLYQPELDTAA
jgi:hypothetical protein